MIRGIFLLTGILLYTVSFSQKKIIVKDVQNEYHKTLRILSLYNVKYYENFTGDSATIKDNQYVFNISNNYDIPRPFRFLFKTDMDKVVEVSEIFFLSEKTENINFDSKEKTIILDKNDQLYNETNNYNRYMKPYLSRKKILDSVKYSINKKKNFKLDKSTTDSLQTLSADLDNYEDSLLLALSKKTPKSFILFWKLVGKFESNGFKQNYLNIFNNFDASIKKSSVGLVFIQRLKEAEKLIPGNKFPDLSFHDKKILSTLGKNYTLIDFWFSYCQPCIEDMPKYKELYSKYKENGFEMVSISSDRPKDIANWKKVIKEKELSWPQYLDENGIKTKFYSINKFPTTFLLDSNGIIIKKDISPEELNEFLVRNLK